jgi:hypothetical protein
MTTPTLKFGDRVRLKFDIIDHPTECLDQIILGGTQGCIGAIVSAAFRKDYKAKTKFKSVLQTLPIPRAPDPVKSSGQASAGLRPYFQGLCPNPATP